jgi:ABC-type bacteriocin/lantibiotic exporter with double-glycine peptidase domain
MKKTEYKIQHQYQPTNTTCSPTALSMLLGFYGKDLSVAEISDKVPQVYNDKNEPQGTINQQMVTWCLSLGFEATLYTFDCQIVDQSWA